MVKDSGSGLSSSAGLMRYFEEEGEGTPKLSPKKIMAFGLVIGILVLSMNIYYGLWP